MDTKEKKEAVEVEAKEKESLTELEEGFTDEEDISEAYDNATEEKKEELKEAEEGPKIDIHKETEESGEETPETPVDTPKSVEDIPELEGIEAARQTFFAFYKKMNRIKCIVTAVVLVIILSAWLIPNFIQVGTDESGNPVGLDSGLVLGIGIGGIAIGLVILIVYNFLFKKATEKETAAYFNSYYKVNDDYVFSGFATDRTGNVDSKLSDELFNAAGCYKSVAKVGSRNCINFVHEGKNVTFADAAAQVKGAKQLETVFVGKFMAVDNSHSGDTVLVYLKGNKTALPPTTLESMNLLEDNRRMVVYGDTGGKRLLTKEVRECLAAFDTDNTLVDLTLVVKAGRTFILFGYNDNLMILPLEKPFDAAPTEHHREDMVKAFKLVDAIEKTIARRA